VPGQRRRLTRNAVGLLTSSSVVAGAGGAPVPKRKKLSPTAGVVAVIAEVLWKLRLLEIAEAVWRYRCWAWLTAQRIHSSDPANQSLSPVVAVEPVAHQRPGAALFGRPRSGHRWLLRRWCGNCGWLNSWLNELAAPSPCARIDLAQMWSASDRLTPVVTSSSAVELVAHQFLEAKVCRPQ
jgi:hypothetical protein